METIEGKTMSADNDVKKITEAFAEQFVAKLLPGAEFIELLNVDLPREPLRADTLIRVRYNGKPYVIIVEWQSYYDRNMPVRLGNYMLLVWAREEIGILAIVIYLHPGSMSPTSWTIDGPFGPGLMVNHQVVALWQEPVADWLATQAPGLMPFVPLLAGASIASLEPAYTNIQQVPNPQQRATLVNFLVTFASRAFGADAVGEFFRRHPVLDTFITESPWYQEIIRRGTEQGIQQGVQQGIQQGVQEGLHQGELMGVRRVLKRMVARRFAAIQGQAESALDAIQDEERLNSLIDALSDAGSAEEALQAILAATEAQVPPATVPTENDIA